MGVLARNGNKEEDPVTLAFHRRNTSMLTVPMTVLFALEKLNSRDDSWTKKSVPTIH